MLGGGGEVRARGGVAERRAVRHAVCGRASQDHRQQKDRGHLLPEAKWAPDCSQHPSEHGLLKRSVWLSTIMVI